jgi:hypothetical protein
MNINNSNQCIGSEELLAKTKLNIEKFGLEVIMVSSTSYSHAFAYSIGLWKSYTHPEIICFGLPNDVGHGVINDVAAVIKDSEVVEEGKIYTDIFEEGRATFIKVDKRNISDYFGAALNYYKNDHFNAMQLTWTDRTDKFSWEEEFEEEFLFNNHYLTEMLTLNFWNLGILRHLQLDNGWKSINLF